MIREITADEVWKRLPERIEDSHKGTYGKVLAVAGSRQYRGAAALCVEGALRTGAGIVTLASVEEVFGTVLPRMPEAICMPCAPSAAGSIASSNSSLLINELSNGCTALLMGCGMTNCADTRDLVRALVPAAGCSAVLDADALNACAVSGLPETAEGYGLVITPHPGEMARLTGTSISDIKKEAAAAASDFSRRNRCVTVLKQHGTIVASPDGHVWINTTGNSGLARGGSGDILAGMTASLLAQGLEPEDAAVCAVWLHGRASEVCSEQNSETAMLPHDIFGALGSLYRGSGRR